MTTRTDFVQPQAGGQGFSRTMKTFGRRVAMAAADVAVSQIVEAFVVPKGFIATGIIAVASDMDANGSPTLALSVGDSGSAVRFLSSSTIGQAGTTTQTLATTGLLYEFTADTKILISATTGAATAAAGTLDLYLTGFMK
jgi:hypothetical protein